MTQRRCPKCRTFYLKKLGDCPECGNPPYGYNQHAVTERLNKHLSGQVEGQHREMERYRRLKAS